MAGYIKLHRGWRENPIFRGEFSRGDAWVWLIENACWKPSSARIKGDTVQLDRGELTFSVRFLADAWGWSKSRVDRFLADLREEGMIETRSKIGTTAGHQAGQGQSIITIRNYAKYQDLADNDRDNGEPEIGTTAGQQRDKEEEGNKGRKNNTPLTPPEWVPADEWAAFGEMRRKARKPMTGHAQSLALKELSKLRSQGQDPAAVLNQSILNGWMGLFPVKHQARGDPEIVIGL